MCCGVVPILFGWFLSVPSLQNACACFPLENFFGLVCAYFFGTVFRNGKREERWGKEKMHTL